MKCSQNIVTGLFLAINQTTRVNGWFALRLKAFVTGQPLKGHRGVRQPHYFLGFPKGRLLFFLYFSLDLFSGKRINMFKHA